VYRDGRKIVLEAFQRRRDQLKASGNRRVTPAAKAKRREQAALIAEIEGLRRDVARLTERLCIWQKNAFLKGLTLEELEAEWHPVDRHQSDPVSRRKLGLPTGLRR
jgi:seryl-tRNA synthetase